MGQTQRAILSLNTSMKGKSTTVCRLDVDSVLKNEVQSGHEQHAVSSSRYSVGRGVKRKLSECDESALDLSYHQQRQLVLDLCLVKLQSCQRQVEPSLYRSVLLANTLRQIQQEMRLEGGNVPPPTSPSQFPPPTPHHVPDLPPVSVDSSLPVSTPSSSSSFSYLTLGEDVEDDIDSRAPSPSLSDDSGPKTLDSLFGTFEFTNSTSYLTDLTLDDIFEDIDTSMYDLSDMSVLPSCSTPTDDCMENTSDLQFCLGDLSDLDNIMDMLWCDPDPQTPLFTP